MIFVLGVGSLVTCPLVGIAPWIMGRNDLRAIERGEMDPEGRGFTQAGMALGILGVALFAFYCLVIGTFVFIALASRSTH